VVIRCERCSTMYELDESLLAPGGSEVQCTKCQHVFTAFPPRSAGRTLVGVPGLPTPPEPNPVPKAEPARAPTAPAAPPRARTGAPAVYRPAASAPVGRAPVLKRDTVGAFEARLRWSARWRWLAPVIAAAVVVGAAGSWLLLARRGSPGASRAHAEALALVALDDAGSLDDAAARLEKVSQGAPKLEGSGADRALALALRAASLLDERDALATKLSARMDERERLRREESAGWQEAERAAAADVAGLESEVRAREERARALSSSAAEQLRAVQSEVGDTAEVVRAAAVLHATHGEREPPPRNARAGRERARRDPWLDLADGWMDARDPDRSIRERALVRLGALAAARPDLLRGRYLLARAQASLGRRAEALATLEGVLAANPHHEGAGRMRDELAAPPPPAPQAPAPAVPGAPTAPVKPPPQSRKKLPPPDPEASAHPTGATPSEVGAATAEPAPTGAALPAPAQAPPSSSSPSPPPPAAPAAAPPVRARPPRLAPPPEPDGSHGG